GLFYQRLARTVVAGRVTGAEAAAIAQEIAIDLAVIAVVNAPENALARADAGVAAQRTVAANAGRVLHVPFAHVLGVQGFIGEDAGRADFFQIAGKLVFERAVAVAPEIDVARRAQHAQIIAVGIVAVKAHAAVAGDAAVHLVFEERAQILILVGAFPAAVTTLRVLGHYRHVLQVALAAFWTHGAVMRVIDHEPFDDFLAEMARRLVRQGNAGAVGSRGHAGHDDGAFGVVFTLVLGYRALAAG